MAARDQIIVRLKSRRAPYTRGGVSFASNREAVERPADALTDDQLRRLADDAAILIEVVTAKGEPAVLQLDDGSSLSSEGLAPASPAPKSKPSADPGSPPIEPAPPAPAPAEAATTSARKKAART